MDLFILQNDSLSVANQALGLSEPLHPLISLLNSSNNPISIHQSGSQVLNFYKISFKPKLTGKVKYGQGYYDLDEGGLLFASPVK